LKEFVNRFGEQVVRVNTTDESMIVYAFRKGIYPGSFSKSLIKSRPKTFAEIRRHAVAHIATEGEVVEKCACVVPTRPRAPPRAQPVRVHEAAAGKKTQGRKQPYEARALAKGRPGGNKPLRHNFVVELKDLIVVPNIADRLKMPAKTDKVLGPHKDAWCEFHQAFGHPINSCLALGHQLDEFVKSGFLNDYLTGSSGPSPRDAHPWGNPHHLRWILWWRVHCLSAQEVRAFSNVSSRAGGGRLA